jgi:hypothetical protein
MCCSIWSIFSEQIFCPGRTNFYVNPAQSRAEYVSAAVCPSLKPFSETLSQKLTRSVCLFGFSRLDCSLSGLRKKNSVDIFVHVICFRRTIQGLQVSQNAPLNRGIPQAGSNRLSFANQSFTPTFKLWEIIQPLFLCPSGGSCE